ncbi:MAG: hypothetical protein LM601_09250 [Candidatus Verstraetearchaeota archaeon]|nr:hypothetical protein [Candidatus Verstraetearchaeota archaeon]
MQQYEYSISSTGNLLCDILSSFGLLELLLMSDPIADVECRLGHYNMLRIKSEIKKEDLEESILKNLITLSKSDQIKQNLNFRVNTGKKYKTRELAYEVLRYLIDERIKNVFSLDSFKPIKKIGKSKELDTLYLSIFPIYGKGLKRYDSTMIGESVRATPEVIVTYMIGLALYTISWKEEIGDTASRIHLSLFPPLGVLVRKDYIRTLRRMAILYSTEDSRWYINNCLEGLPKLALPMAILANLDVSTLMYLKKIHPPQIILFDIEQRGGRAAEESRLYRIYDTTVFLDFFLGLSEQIHEAKEYILSLIKLRGSEKVKKSEKSELRNIVDSLLLELSYAILNRDSNKLIRVLFESGKLEDRVGGKLKEELVRRLHKPKPDLSYKMVEYVLKGPEGIRLL